MQALFIENIAETNQRPQKENSNMEIDSFRVKQKALNRCWCCYLIEAKSIRELVVKYKRKNRGRNNSSLMYLMRPKSFD